MNFDDRMGESYPLRRLRPCLLMNGADRIGEGASCILMNFSNRRGSSRPSGRVRPRRFVGTRGGCGDGWGPGACPGEWRVRQGFLLTRWILSPGGGQAQGPLIHPTPPLVPTGRLTSLAAFGRQHSSGGRVISLMCIIGPIRGGRVILSKWIIGTYSCNCLAGHAVSFDYHLLLDYIGQRLGRVLDGDEVGVAGTVPYDVEPVAFGVAARLQPLVGSQFYKFALAGARFDLAAASLSSYGA